jgi:hypothetical protein
MMLRAAAVVPPIKPSLVRKSIALLLATAAVPLASVPMKLPCTNWFVPLLPLIKIPAWVLPEMTLRAAREVLPERSSPAVVRVGDGEGCGLGGQLKPLPARKTYHESCHCQHEAESSQTFSSSYQASHNKSSNFHAPITGTTTNQD